MSHTDQDGRASAVAGALSHGTAVVEGVHLHFVEVGRGPPVLLLPGWPQSWYAWRRVMPRLAAAGRRAIALDPRGCGDSDRPDRGYDMATVAAEIHGFARALGLLDDGPVDVAGHDLGTWMGFAYAADWPGDVRRLALLDALLPGVTPPLAALPSAEANLRTWHFAFNRLDDLPEILIAGREREFLTWLFRAKAMRPWAIGPEDLDEYARQLAAPGALRAAGAYYRAAFSPEGLERNRGRAAARLGMPVLALGAERGVGAAIMDAMRAAADDVRGGVVSGCGHYMPEEDPDRVVEELIAFFGPAGAPPRAA